MPNPTSIARSRSTALLLALVLGLHALVLLSLAQLGAWRDRGPPPVERPPLQVWLLNALQPRLPSARPQEPAAPPPRAARRPEAPPAATPRGEPQAITPPAMDAAADPGTARAATPAVSATPPPPAPALTAASSPPPLNLALPRSASAPWRQRNPALDDPRSNTRRTVNMGSLIGRALSDDASEPITEERLQDGSIRFRRGNRCLIVHPSQTQNMNPFNSSFSPKPGVVDDC